MSDHSHRPGYDIEAGPPDRRVKVTHLVFGLLFLGLAGVWALVESDVITSDRLTVLGPAVLIAAGVIGLVASLANGRSRQPKPAEQPYPAIQHDEHTEHTEEIR